MKKSKTPFFELLGALSPEEAAALGHFARTSIHKCSKKAIQLLELATEALKESKKTEKQANWLRRKLYPNDDTGRYFLRVLKEVEDILRGYLAFRELQRQPVARQLLLLESLPLPKFEGEFQSQLDKLRGLLEDSPIRNSGHALDSYKYELFHERSITQKKDKGRKHNYYATLAHLGRFYLIEKLKYATALKLWSNIYQEEPPASLNEQVEYLAGLYQEQIAEDPVLQIYQAAYQLYYDTADSQKAIRLLSTLLKKFLSILYIALKKPHMKKEHVKLTDKDREQLLAMLQKGSLKSRAYKRANSLLALDKGKTYSAVSENTHLSPVSLRKLARNYAKSGLDCLSDAPRSGRPIKVDQAQEDQIVLLSCSEPPKGYSQWSLRLIADKMVELGHSDEISYSQVSNVLKKRKLNRT